MSCMPILFDYFESPDAKLKNGLERRFVRRFVSELEISYDLQDSDKCTKSFKDNV